MKHKRWIALLLAAVLTVGVMSVSAFAANVTESEAEASAEESAAKPARGRHGHREKLAEPENAVGKDAAKESALADAGVGAEDVGRVKARVTRLEDGTVVYRVSFTAGELWYCYKIDALSGEILDKRTEDAAAHEAAKAARGTRSSDGAESAEEESESAGRGHGRGGRHSSDTAEDQTDPAADGGRRRDHTGGAAKPAAEEDNSL